MPRTDQAPLLVDRPIGEIGTEMPTTASYREQLTVRVSDRVPSGTADNPRYELGGGPHLNLSCHRPSNGSLAFTVTGVTECDDDSGRDLPSRVPPNMPRQRPLHRGLTSGVRWTPNEIRRFLMHPGSRTAVERGVDHSFFDAAEVAAAAFLARYTGRTLDAHRQDLRSFFSWANRVGLDVLAATRPHIELYRQHMDQRALAASTVDRRLSTVCGFYKFAHIDGRIAANPAQYVRRPKVHPSGGRGLDRGELGRFLFTAERVDRQHAALAVLLGLNGLRVTKACEANIEDLGFDRGHRTLRIVGQGNKPALTSSAREPTRRSMEAGR